MAEAGDHGVPRSTLSPRAAARCALSSSPSSSASTSSVCCPSIGGARRIEVGVSVNLNGNAEHLQRADGRMLDRLDHVARRGCGSASASATVLIRPQGMPAALSFAIQASAVSRCQRLLDQAVERVAVGDAVAVGREARDRSPIPDGRAPRRMRRTGRRCRPPPRSCRRRPDRSCRARCWDGRCRNGRRPCRRPDGWRRHWRASRASVSKSETSTCWPWPVRWRAFSAARIELQASMPVQMSTIATPYFIGVAVGLAADAHQAGLGLQDEVVAGQRRLRPARAVAGDRAAHHARRVRLEPVVGEAPLLERAELEVLDQHVGLARSARRGSPGPAFAAMLSVIERLLRLTPRK